MRNYLARLSILTLKEYLSCNKKLFTTTKAAKNLSEVLDNKGLMYGGRTSDRSRVNTKK